MFSLNSFEMGFIIQNELKIMQVSMLLIVSSSYANFQFEIFFSLSLSLSLTQSHFTF